MLIKLWLQLQGKTDQKFVEASFRLFRDCLNVKTVLTAAQFLEQVGLSCADMLAGEKDPPRIVDPEVVSKKAFKHMEACAVVQLFRRALLSASCCLYATSLWHASASTMRRYARSVWLP